MKDATAAAGLSLALGRCDEMRAELLVQAVATAGGAPRLSGTLTGPRRGRDTTLPVTARLQPAPSAGACRVVLTEPAYWTPELPNLYRLQATIDRDDTPPAAIDRLVGLRRLGIRGRSLWLDGRRWVPRGVAAGAPDLAACKAACVAAIVTDPDDATLARADEIGVAVIALAAVSAAEEPVTITDRIAAWAAHPSAVVALLPAETPAATAARIAAAVRPRKDSLLLALTVSGTAPPPAPPPGIDVLVVALDADATPHAAWRTGAAVPLIAGRRARSVAGIDRAPCDALQAALAAWGTAGGREPLAWDWAGYLVG